jgi:glycosyltransferase involved in cell wall biosynthesis
MDTPLVSILMTAYNREKYIGDAIESALASTYKNFELIVVDDCSTDNTLAIARQYEAKDERVKVYQNEVNLGDYPNRNNAASYAIGKYLKYLDSDDLIYDHGLEVFVKYMEKHPSVAIGICSTGDQLDSPFPKQFNPSETLRFHFFVKGILEGGPSGAIIRRDCFYEAGTFSGKRLIGDTELWLRIAARYPVLILPPSLIYWREHQGQEYRSNDSEMTYFANSYPMIKESLTHAGEALTEQEKKWILNKQKISVVRRLLAMVKQGKIFLAVEYYRIFELKAIDVVRGLIVRFNAKKGKL